MIFLVDAWDDVDHGCCCLMHNVNDCSGHELENGSQDEIVPEEFGNKPEVVFSPSVSTCPSLAAGLERDGGELAELDEIGRQVASRRGKKAKRRGETLQRKRRRLIVDSCREKKTKRRRETPKRKTGKDSVQK